MSAIPITVTGTIATDPTARTLPSGRACASFRLAVNHWRVDRATGEFLDDGTSWFGVDSYGDLASNSSMSLRKGTAVIVSGSLRNREWETDERSGIAPTVVADHIGPDLRYGTAHYRRAKGQDRPENPTKKAATDTEGTEAGGWGALGSAVSDTDETGSTTPSAEAGGYRGADESHTTVASSDTNSMTGDEGADTNGTTGDEGADTAGEFADDTRGSGADDAAIAAKTAAAAAPF